MAEIVYLQEKRGILCRGGWGYKKISNNFQKGALILCASKGNTSVTFARVSRIIPTRLRALVELAIVTATFVCLFFLSLSLFTVIS